MLRLPRTGTRVGAAGISLSSNVTMGGGGCLKGTHGPSLGDFFLGVRSLGQCELYPCIPQEGFSQVLGWGAGQSGCRRPGLAPGVKALPSAVGVLKQTLRNFMAQPGFIPAKPPGRFAARLDLSRFCLADLPGGSALQELSCPPERYPRPAAARPRARFSLRQN